MCTQHEFCIWINSVFDFFELHSVYISRFIGLFFLICVALFMILALIFLFSVFRYTQ